MSLAQIEKDLKNLSPTELRRLSLQSWKIFLEKEGLVEAVIEVDETDPALLASLDEAIRRADATPDKSASAEEVRARLVKWTSK